MKLMTKHQFEVVKLMQRGGATPESFAKHTGEPVPKMQAAFNAPSYEKYIEAGDKPFDFMDMFKSYGL